MAPDGLVDALERRYESVQDVIDGLGAVEAVLRSQRDRRAVFATGYLNMTLEIGRRVQGSSFLDPAWAARYAACFANLYRTALLAFEQGRIDAVPKPWRIAFETSRAGHGLILQDLLLGMNAHINHDLPLALVEVTIDPEREKRRRDHFAVNEAIRAATDPVQEQVARLYAPVLRLLDIGFKRLDEDVANFSVAKARLNAWVSAIALAGAADEDERAAVLDSISDRASVMAKLILAPTPNRRAIALLRRAESLLPWWKIVTRNR
jgi:hypothetical protein